MKKILLTGLTGFIGRNVAEGISKKKYEIDALVRPATNPKRTEAFKDYIHIHEIDLADVRSLKRFLSTKKYDVILHIGALRGGRKYSKNVFHNVNVKATEQLVTHAFKNQSKFIFCSSVGVFGAIPLELPANNQTRKQNDNYYHLTKNLAEDCIQKYVMHGLNAVIIRPSITYGIGDFGFPHTLTKLIDKHLLYLPTKPVLIHLTHVDLLKEAFKQSIEQEIPAGSELIVADRNPVMLLELANYIHNELHKKPFPASHLISEKFFKTGINIAKKLKSEIWTSRFELISKDWYYRVEDAYQIFSLKKIETIPHFKIVIDWYKNGNSHHK